MPRSLLYQVLVVSVMFLGCSHSSFAGSEWSVLLDPGTLNLSFSPELDQADQNRLLTGIFGDRYEDVQAAITGYATGSFLRPNTSQEVVVVQFPGPNLLQPSEGRVIVAIVDGNRVALLSLPPSLGPFILGTVDGLINEDLLILGGEKVQMGERVGNISIISLKEARIESVAEFPQAWQDPCESPLGPTEGRSFVRIKMRRPHPESSTPDEDGLLPLFRAVPYSQPCPSDP